MPDFRESTYMVFVNMAVVMIIANRITGITAFRAQLAMVHASSETYAMSICARKAVQTAIPIAIVITTAILTNT